MWETFDDLMSASYNSYIKKELQEQRGFKESLRLCQSLIEETVFISFQGFLYRQRRDV